MACFVNHVSPNNLLIGQSKEIIITGGGFISPLAIVFNGNSIAPSLLTSNIIKFILPTSPSGTYNLIILNGDGTRWLTNSAITINENVSLNALIGSASLPIVLPQRIIDSTPTATQTNNLNNLSYNTVASVTVDTEHNTAVGRIPVDTSYIGSQNSTTNSVTESENALSTINSPWGSFTNIK